MRILAIRNGEHCVPRTRCDGCPPFVIERNEAEATCFAVLDADGCSAGAWQADRIEQCANLKPDPSAAYKPVDHLGKPGGSDVQMIAAWRASGYTVKLVFLSLRAPEDAIARVAMRVRQGGHDVAASTIRRRFTAGLRNFAEIYRHRVDYWHWLDNGGPEPVLLDECRS